MTEQKISDPPYGMNSEAREKWDKEQKKLLKKQGLENSLDKTPKNYNTIRNLGITALALGVGILGVTYFSGCSKQTIPKGYLSPIEVKAMADSAYAVGIEQGILKEKSSLKNYQTSIDSLVSLIEERDKIIEGKDEQIRTMRYIRGQ